MKISERELCKEIMKIILFSGQSPEILRQFFDENIVEEAKVNLFQILNGGNPIN